MSIDTYPIDTYGVILTVDDLDRDKVAKILKSVVDLDSFDNEAYEQTMEDYLIDGFREAKLKQDVENYAPFDGEVTYIKTGETEFLSDESLCIYVIDSNLPWEPSPYTSFENMIDLITPDLRKIVYDNFDIAKHVIHVSGTTWG